MTFETYFPEQRHMLALTLIRRERLLSADTEGEVETPVGARVTLKDVIARGAAHTPYHLLNAMQFFRLKSPADLEPLLQVSVGDIVSATQTLAAKGRKRLVSPIVGRVAAIDGGHIVLQEAADTVDLEAGLNGQVVEVRKGRGVVIETFGAVLQGVWGNNRRAIGTIRIEPPSGVESIDQDVMDLQYRGAIIVTRRPITDDMLNAVASRGFAGLVAPSMETDMIRDVEDWQGAVLLTDGFGAQRMSMPTYQFLNEMDGRQATLDALRAMPLEVRRPELLITVPLSAHERPSAPLTNVSLQQGMQVRVVRGDGNVAFGQVIGLPKAPVLLDNGLRVQCAQVELVTGEKLAVPLANIEIPGR